MIDTLVMNNQKRIQRNTVGLLLKPRVVVGARLDKSGFEEMSNENGRVSRQLWVSVFRKRQNVTQTLTI